MTATVFDEDEAMALVSDLILTHHEFYADVLLMRNRGTSYTKILTWLETAVRKSKTKDNGFSGSIPAGMEDRSAETNHVSNYYVYLAEHADQFNTINPDFATNIGE